MITPVIIKKKRLRWLLTLGESLDLPLFLCRGGAWGVEWWFWPCPVASGIFVPRQGLNLCPLKWRHKS